MGIKERKFKPQSPEQSKVLSAEQVFDKQDNILLNLNESYAEKEESISEQSIALVKDEKNITISSSLIIEKNKKRGPKPKMNIERSNISGAFSELSIKGLEELYIKKIKEEPMKAQEITYSSIVWDLIQREKHMLENNKYTGEELRLKYNSKRIVCNVRRSYQLPIKEGNKLIQNLISIIEDIASTRITKGDFFHNLILSECLKLQVEI